MSNHTLCDIRMSTCTRPSHPSALLTKLSRLLGSIREVESKENSLREASGIETKRPFGRRLRGDFLEQLKRGRQRDSLLRYWTFAVTLMPVGKRCACRRNCHKYNCPDWEVEQEYWRHRRSLNHPKRWPSHARIRCILLYSEDIHGGNQRNDPAAGAGVA